MRGHNAGVTSLTYYQLPDDRQPNPYLVSGDEDGCIVVWNLSTFRRVVQFVNIFRSTIQSIKSVNLIVGDKRTDALVVQSRNDGVQVWDICNSPGETIGLAPNILASFPTYDSLFSRGDALSTESGRAILAHPSLLENHLTTIRILGRDAKTEVSGTASYGKQSEKKFPVFDIIIKSLSSDDGVYHLFVAYEDGFINIYKFQLCVTQTVPVLNSEGLEVKLMKRIDLGFKDFVSAYDVSRSALDNEGDYLIVAGSPGKNLCFTGCSVEFAEDHEPKMHVLRLKTSGVSALSLKPEVGLVAVASWDKSVSLYSTGQDHSLVATLDHHTKQVQAVLFVPKPASLFNAPDDLESVPNNAANGQQNSFLLCCASQDGTITISSLDPHR